MELSRRSPKNSTTYAPEARHASVPDHNATYIVLFYFLIYVPHETILTMCLYTKYILNKKYMYTKKNQGNVPECNDERLRYVPTKCGKCIECRKEKARNWRIRLAEELKNNPDALFITLTFNEENYQKRGNCSRKVKKT
jgi:hypothetical protein